MQRYKVLCVGRQFKNSRITCMCNDSKDDSQIDLNWLDRVLIVTLCKYLELSFFQEMFYINETLLLCSSIIITYNSVAKVRLPLGLFIIFTLINILLGQIL